MALLVRPVDPRDVTVEVEGPTYRVDFWTGDRACRELELQGADVETVLAWAERHRRPDETCTVHVVVRVGSDVVLARLSGAEPPSTGPASSERPATADG